MSTSVSSMFVLIPSSFNSKLEYLVLSFMILAEFGKGSEIENFIYKKYILIGVEINESVLLP